MIPCGHIEGPTKRLSKCHPINWILANHVTSRLSYKLILLGGETNEHEFYKGRKGGDASLQFT